MSINGSNITNLDGLAEVTKIEGSLNIYSNPSLTDLSGLNALTSIEGSLYISNNASLISLEGLDNIAPNTITNLTILGSNVLSTCNVQSICDYLSDPSNAADIFGNSTGCASVGQIELACGLPVSCPNDIYFSNQAQIDAFPVNYPGCSTVSGKMTINGNDITNLSGLAQITSIGGDLVISYNSSLASLSGLDALTTVGGNLRLQNNESLADLSALEALFSIGGGLYVYNNAVLTTLDGLDNIDPNSITYLSIYSSNVLSICNVQSICDYLSDPSNISNITGNATGCSSTGQILLACGLPVPCPADISFSNQAQIDAYPINYPGCSVILGNVTINGSNITNLDGLAEVTTIGGGLSIVNNPSLIDLSGLNALTSIGGNLYIYNNAALTSLEGLNYVTLIGTSLIINDNPVLTDLTGLISLNSIGGFLFVQNNAALTSLSGLDNIDPNTITTLYITSSNELGTCNVQSICDYLSDPSNSAFISGNATGCASVPEVQVACGLPGTCTGNYYFYSQADIDAFPVNNPFCSIITGNVTIQGADITNLAGLAQISSIQGNFSIGWNYSLSSLSGLNALTSIGGNLHMGSNNSLINLSGFESLTSIGGYFYVNSNSSLVDFSGLESLSSIGGYFDILNSPSLANLSGLNALTSIGGYLRIFSNNSLSDLTGLGSVTSIGGELNIINNSNLTSLSGLDNINPSTITNLIIENSNELYLCNIPSICGYLSEPSNTATIIGNALGCANITEVVSICDGCFPEQIISHPQDQCASNGTTFSFSVEVEGTPPFSYQWYENSTLVPGETSASFTINPVTFAYNGNTYYCEVSNCSGTFLSTSNIATLRVFDISCPSNITVNNDIGQCCATVNFSTPIAVGSCLGTTVSLTEGLPPGSCFPVGITTNTYTATAPNGQTASCSFNVIVTDVTPPTISCPANINKNTDFGQCSAVVNYSSPLGTDNCPGANTTQIAGLPSGGVFPTGVTTNTFRVVADNGQTATCSFSVTVTDNQAPTIYCPSNISRTNATNLCGRAVYFIPPIGSDNCLGATTIQTSGLASGALFPVGTTTNTYKVTAANGQAAFCSFTVSIVDTQPPTITCPYNIYANLTPDQCSAEVNFTPPIGVDNCSNSVTTQIAGLPSGSIFPIGATINTFRVTAANGQTASCSFSVIVSDITPPTINCPSDIYVESDPEQCSSIVTFILPNGEDFCSIPIISQISGLESGSVYPVGQTINVFKAVDQSGNIATCSFTVTVSTPEGLFIECPDDITVNLAPGICTAEVNFSITPNPDCFTSKPLIQYNNPSISNAGALGCYFAYTSFWRVFNLNEFGINTGYLLKSVTTAVVNASEDEFTLRIYLLNGSFAPGNLTLIGEKSMSLSGNGIYIEIPLDSPILIPAGSTFVVELAAMPVPPFGPSGQNQLGESAPTYFSSAGCGINNPIPISSLGFSFIGLFHPNGTVMDNVSIINQSEINPIINQPYNSGDEYPPGITPMSFLVSSDAGSSSICSFSIGVTPGTGCQTINIVESVIPPWQRENDPFEGNVTVETVNPSNASWHLEIDVIDLLTGGVLSTIEYPSITSNTQYFFSADPQLNAASTEGRQMRYYAVLDQVDLRIEVAKKTNIIEKKWNYKNVVVFNDEVTTEIKIPIRYDPNVPGSSTSVEIYRFGNVSLDLELSELSLKKPNNLVDNLGSPSFPVGSDGYVTIKAWNSNLESLWPGDFYIDVKSDQGEVLEKMYFDLTKIGQVFSNSTLNNKAIIVIGGLYNDIEGNVKVLDENKNNPGIKDFSYSLLLELFNEGFDIWYIAQGNANSIKRNGHDIGLATYSIIDQNPQIEELNFLCHSKGGLDLRAFLSGMTESFDGSSPVSFESSPTFSIIEKVLFLGTPHNGALDFYKTLKNFYKYGNSPGAKEALKEDNTLDELNDLELPNTIYYANLSGYRSKKKLKNFNPFSSNESVFDKNSFYPSDGVVSTLSSFNFTSKYFFENSVKQLFQNSNELLPPSHFDLHKTSYLETTNYLYQEVNCLPSPLSTNLKKIIDFFNEDQIDLNTPFTSCPHPNTLNIVFNVIGSWIPGAVISIRPQNDTVFYFLGFTNEEGSFSGSLIPSPQIGDSIRIEATGYETISLVVDSNYLEKRKFGVSMVESSVATLKVKDPSLSFKNGAPFLSSNFCIMEAKGENVLNFEVNQPFNQDTIFVPLQLQNDQFSAQLDTGYNQILVRFIGSLDTVTLSKEVFFLPDTLFAAFTNYVTIISDSVSLGAKLYSNNQYLKEISSPLEVVPLFLGENHLQFIKFGYIDSILTVNSDTTINLSLQLIPHSYSSPFDGNIINFPLQGKLQYRRNVTMLDADQASIISLKQYDDDFPGMGLIPKSRKFEYRNLNAPIWSNIKTATILDQIEDLCPDSVYLLRVLDDAQYEKILFDTTGNIAAYDSTVQKLTYNYVNFKQGLANKEAIAIMKKKAPKAKATPDYMVFQNESMTIPVSDLFVDPDSIKNDMTFQIQPGSPDGVSAIVSNGNIVITPNFCFFGKATLTIVATHDGLKANNTLNILVSSSAVTNCLNNATTSENGQFLETMEVTGTPGDNWTVMMVAGLFQEGSPAPPSLPVPIMIGTPLSEITSGIFQLQGKHIDALGYTVQLTNGMETVCFSNLAYYPNPSLTGLSSEYCTQDGPQTVTVTAQLGDGSGQATVENILFELIRLSDNSVVGSQSGTNDTFQFDPSTLQNGSHKLRVTFDALLDGSAHPGCMQSIEEAFLVKKVGCGEFPWDGN